MLGLSFKPQLVKSDPRIREMWGLRVRAVGGVELGCGALPAPQARVLPHVWEKGPRLGSRPSAVGALPLWRWGSWGGEGCGTLHRAHMVTRDRLQVASPFGIVGVALWGPRAGHLTVALA